MFKLILALTLGVAATAGCYGTTGYVSDGYYDGAYYSSYPSYYYGAGYYGSSYPYYYNRGHYAPYAHYGHGGYYGRGGYYGGTYGRGYYGGTYGRGYYGNSRTIHPGDARPHAAGTAVGSPWAASRGGHRH